MTLIKASRTSCGNGRFYTDVDFYAGQHLDQGAAELFATLMRVQAAEPFTDAEERTKHLRTLLEASLDDLLTRMTEGRERFLKHWDKLSPPPAEPVPRPEFKALPKAASYTRERYRELIHVDVTALSNRGGDQRGAVNNFNAPVGAVQTGDNAVAHVEQHPSPERQSPPPQRPVFAVLKQGAKWVVGTATALLVVYIGFKFGWN